MAAKMQCDLHKGRCNRCYLSYRGKPGSEYKIGNMCFRYGTYCQRVAWNCVTISIHGFKKKDLLKKQMKELDKLKLIGKRAEREKEIDGLISMKTKQEDLVILFAKNLK